MKIIAKIGTHSSQEIKVVLKRTKRQFKVGERIIFKHLEDSKWMPCHFGIVTKTEPILFIDLI